MVKVEKIERRNGCDCWGRPEYDTVYIVIDENGNKIYESKEDPIKLVDFLTNNTDSNNMDSAWDIALKLCRLNENEREEIFDYSKLDTIITQYTAHQVNHKIKEYKNKKEIYVGDIVTINDGDLTFVCTKDNSSGDYNMCHLVSFDGSVWEDCKKSNCKKTGRTIDINEILKQIK